MPCCTCHPDGYVLSDCPTHGDAEHRVRDTELLLDCHYSLLGKEVIYRGLRDGRHTFEWQAGHQPAEDGIGDPFVQELLASGLLKSLDDRA